MAEKISQADLNALEAQGVTVRRKLPVNPERVAPPPPNPVDEIQKSGERQSEATQQALGVNAELVRSLNVGITEIGESLRNLSAKEEPETQVQDFEIIRDPKGPIQSMRAQGIPQVQDWDFQIVRDEGVSEDYKPIQRVRVKDGQGREWDFRLIREESEETYAPIRQVQVQAVTQGD